MAGAPSKSIDRTVFVRFVPPSPNIRRHHLEDLFSQVGPIKKSSVIHSNTTKTSSQDQQHESFVSDKPSSYGFVKYTSQKDAEEAAKQLNGKSLAITETETVIVKVELAKTATKSSSASAGQLHKPTKQSGALSPVSGTLNSENLEEDEMAFKKKNARVILRNLAFSANESRVKQVLEARFGPVLDVHIPVVAVKADSTVDKSLAEKQSLHRGFCFVTFEHVKDATACVESQQIDGYEPILIHNRPVKVAFSLNRTAFEQQKQKQQQNNTVVPGRGESHNSGDGSKTLCKIAEDHEGNKSRMNDDVESENENDDDESSSESSSTKSDKHIDDGSGKHIDDNDDDEMIVEGKAERKNDEKSFTLFVRNLPFDVTRHDLFSVMYKFGRISSIYLVKSPDTGLLKGTAFVSYATKEDAERAFQAASAKPGMSGIYDDAALVGGIVFKGRTLLIDWAVDRKTAGILSSEKKQEKVTGKDRRNLYLKDEGRVNNIDNSGDAAITTSSPGILSWQALPEVDQEKRQRAWSEKIQKLRSPLFFINPTRLSIRNLAKHVTTSNLKELCAKAVQRGLKHKLVTAQDQIAHWKAQGDLTTREILARLKEFEESKSKSIIPAFDEKNIKKYLTSVFIDRDMEKDLSRGFGFVEFQHHAHALACLRELNNKPRYSKEYVLGGAHALKMKRDPKRLGKKAYLEQEATVKIPRLIVEFTVENKAKAKHQAEHRAQQEANSKKQRAQKFEKSGNDSSSNKSRGARQRERKRKQCGEDQVSSTSKPPQRDLISVSGLGSKDIKSHQNNESVLREKHVIQLVKPSKKHKVDKSELKLMELVNSHEQSFDGPNGSNEHKETQETSKRWFD